MGAILFFLAFYAVVFLAVYLIMQASPVEKTRQVLAKSAKWLREVIDDPGEAAGALAILGIVIGILGFVFLYTLKFTSNLVSDFYANIATELLSISITVLIIDKLYARRRANEEKQRTIRQLASPGNEFALEAVRLCAERGWSGDGSLQGADLSYANLEGAHFWSANLKGVDLALANLKDAILVSADLQGAALGGANLERAILGLTNFQGADLSGANLQGTNLWGVNFQYANLFCTNLEGACYDANTVWPDDFDLATADALDWDEMGEDDRKQFTAKISRTPW